MAKTNSSIPSTKLDLYERLIAATPGVECKGAAMPYTSFNGHMFSFLTPEGKLALRLPEAERETFLKKYTTHRCQQHGTVLKEYVEVPEALLKKTAELREFFKQSLAYVSTLKPKPTKKKATLKKPGRKK